MNNQAESIGIIYLDQNGMMIYTSSTQTVLQLGFTKESVSDMEIINKELFINTIKDFFSSNSSTLTPFKAYILVSTNILYEKSFKSPVIPEEQKAIDAFLDSVPFDHVGTTIFENGESKVIAANKEFYSSVMHACEDFKSQVLGVIPAYILNIDVNQILSINQGILSEIFRKAASMKQYSFMGDEYMQDRKKLTSPQQSNASQHPSQQQSSEFRESKETQSNEGAKKNMRLFVLVGVFAVLIVILIFVAVTML